MPVAKLKEEKAGGAYEILSGCSILTERQCPFCEIIWKSNDDYEPCPLLELEIEVLGANWFDEGFVN